MRWLIGMMCLAAVSATAQGSTPFAGYAGASEAVLSDPHDLAFGPDGFLYIADKFAGRVVRMDPDTLEVLDSFGDGALLGVHDVSFGPDGKLYVAVTGLSGVAIYGIEDGVATSEGMLGPFSRTEGALAHSNGRLYVMASGEGVLYAVDGDQAVARASGMPGAHDVAEAPDGSIWVADNFNRRLVQFDAELNELRVLQGAKYGFVGLRYMDFSDDGLLIVADQDAHRILKIDPFSGDVLGVLGDGMPGVGANKFDDPEGVAVRGNAYFFADSDNNQIVKYLVVVN